MFAYANINETEIESFFESDFENSFQSSGFSSLPDPTTDLSNINETEIESFFESDFEDAFQSSGFSSLSDPTIDPDTPSSDSFLTNNQTTLGNNTFEPDIPAIPFNKFDFDTEYFVESYPQNTTYSYTDPNPEPDTHNETIVLDYYEAEDYSEMNITLSGKNNFYL
jgi:hypothetical protein